MPENPHTTRPDLASMVERFRRGDDWESLVNVIPYTKFLGLRVEASPEERIVKLPYAPRLIGNPVLPALHGGTVAALLESSAIFELIFQSETAFVPKIITLTIDYLRSGRPVDTFAVATITKQGRRIANVRAESWQDDRSRPIAAAHCLFLVSGSK